MLRIRSVAVTASLGLMVTAANGVLSQDYPNKPIRIFTAAAGGGSDLVSRQIAEGLSATLGQQVIVENRPALISIETVSKAPPDAYTLLVVSEALWMTPLIQKTPWDVVRDFSPITLVEKSLSVLVVHPSVPANSVQELIALAKAKPGALNYGSTGIAGSTHLAAELFNAMAGVNIVGIMYKGTAPAITGLMGGELHLMFASVGPVAPHIKSGKLRALAVSSAQPSALLPGLPTVAAAGVPGYESVGVTGMSAPAKTPGAIIDRLNQEVVRLLNRADVKERFLKAGVELVGTSPEQFAATIKSDIAKWGKLIKDVGIKID